ncbi:MAG: tetratricopeptide repeat protein [Ardenticatenaceae bacterium]|nr:tetratricopeptide repeat protein [Ardenticatenaceae bacterium]
MTTGSGAFSSVKISTAALIIYRQGRQAARDGQYQEAIRFYTDAFDFKDADSVFRARVLEYRGECHWLLGDFDAAEADYQTSHDLSEDAEQQARAIVRLAEVADFRGNYDQSRDLYQQALKDGLAANLLWVIGRARRGLGILSRRHGNMEQAVSHLTQALAAFRQLGAAREQARVLTSLGRARHARGEYHYALTAHQEALTIFESLQDSWRVVQTLNDIGEVHQALYDTENARTYHEKALKLANEYGADVIKPDIQRNLGVDMVEQGFFEEGLAYLQSALNGARQIGYRDQEALALYALARAYLRRAYVNQAQQAVAQLHDVAEDLDADRFRALAAFAWGELLFHQDERQAAIAELNAAMLAAQASLDTGVLWKLHATMAHVVDNENIAAVHLNIAAEFIRQTVEPLPDPQLRACFVYAPPVLAVLHEAGIDPDKLVSSK